MLKKKLVVAAVVVLAAVFVSAAGDLNQRLSTLAEQNPKRANEVVQYLIANSQVDTAVSAIAARGRFAARASVRSS